MAITKEIFDDKIEIVGENRAIQVRTATIIKEDGVELTRSFSRRVINCVTSVQNANSSWTHTDTDTSPESEEIQKIATAVWNTAAKNAQKAINEGSV